jgi:hypothetical protein
MRGTPKEEIENLLDELKNDPVVIRAFSREIEKNHSHITVRIDPDSSEEVSANIKKKLRSVASKHRPASSRNLVLDLAKRARETD